MGNGSSSRGHMRLEEEETQPIVPTERNTHNQRRPNERGSNSNVNFSRPNYRMSSRQIPQVMSAPQPFPLPVSAPVQTQTTLTAMQSHFNITSVKLEEKMLTIHYDATANCSISIHCNAKEESDLNDITSRVLCLDRNFPPLQPLVIPTGSDQMVQILIPHSPLVPLSVPDCIPCLIVVTTTDDKGVCQNHLFFYSIQSNGDLRLMRRKLEINGRGYDLMNVYGMAKKSNTEKEDSTTINGEEKAIKKDEESTEDFCVICLDEPKNTAVMPCRHCCVCQDCAKGLSARNQTCPICRTPIQSFLVLNIKK
eukprot:TRINITY_DN773143_c0_g1_i1.p1 TRINITY_DN773143_c0_g1~~TRINITY_DN773143_c0_g1_i1.p1  ORF type:complete len:309 (+),score=68.68 TRINITY_DN773143_c0_g1_i1:152-1078(+)